MSIDRGSFKNLKKPKPYWPALLCISIVFTYGFFLFLHIPTALLGKRFTVFWRLSGQIFKVGVRVLIGVQPWIKWERRFARIDLNRPTLIVSNHRSHLDVFYFLSTVPNIRVLAKKKFFSIPLFGLGLRLLRLIPIENDDFDVYRKALKEVKKVLVTVKDPVLFFPEMTRCEEGLKGLGKFSLTPFQIAFDAKATVIPTVLLGSDLSWPKGTFGGRFRKKNLLKSLEPVYSGDFKSARDLQKYVREVMEKEIQHQWENYY